MVIKDGFNNKDTEIRVLGNQENQSLEVWIEIKGIKDPDRKEFLCYASTAEVLALREECNEAIKKYYNLP